MPQGEDRQICHVGTRRQLDHEARQGKCAERSIEMYGIDDTSSMRSQLVIEQSSTAGVASVAGAAIG